MFFHFWPPLLGRGKFFENFTNPSICTCSLFTASMVVNCLVGTEIVGGVVKDLEHTLLKESWHFGAIVVKSDEVDL